METSPRSDSVVPSPFDATAWQATLQSIASELGQCGQSFELWQERFSNSVERQLAQLPPEHREEAVVLAVAQGYATPAELAAEAEASRNDGWCGHHFPPNCCPLGCDDIDRDCDEFFDEFLTEGDYE